MSVSRLPNGRWRAQVYANGKTLSAAKVLGLPPEQSTFSSKRKAEDAVAQARRLLASRASSGVTVGEWAQQWLTDPFWQRPKESTNLRRAGRLKAFGRPAWQSEAFRPPRGVSHVNWPVSGP